jgi:hypothetical protein
MTRLKTLSCFMVLATITGASEAQAYEPKKDWPCIQVKVPELSPAMMWAGPDLNGASADWRKNPNVESTAKKLIVRRYTDDQVAKFIKQYKANIRGSGNQLALTQLFAAAFHLASAERKDVIAGIERFTRRQRELANQIHKTRQELEASLEIQDPSDKELSERREIEERLNWQTRIFDDREKSTKYVCEVPTLIEKRLFLIAREVANELAG